MDNQQMGQGFGGGMPGVGSAGGLNGASGGGMGGVSGGISNGINGINSAASLTLNKPRQRVEVPLWMWVGLVLMGAAAVIMTGLFIWMYIRWDTAATDVEGQINKAVATAVNEAEEALEASFEEREKSPYNTFSGPSDYGELQFQYPKTWSVYEAKDASGGGDYEAYLNPDKVYAVSTNTINALRVTIKDQSYDSYVTTYDSNVKKGVLMVSTTKVNGQDVTLYTGELPSSKAQGIAAVFKLRDKTVILQTDAMLFEDDFMTLLSTVTYKD